MSLIGFHRFLIVIAIAFCLGFGVWEFNSVTSGGGPGAVALGSIFTLLGIGLGVYLGRLARVLGYEDDRSMPD